MRSWPGAAGPLADQDTAQFGAIGLYVGGTGEVRYKDVAWKDINAVELPDEVVNSRFTIQRLTELYYGWSAVSSDINRDGAMDIISGPFYYLGPSFTVRRIFRSDRVYNPATEYAPDMVNFTYDYTGDGWPDILASGWDRKLGTRPIDLYVNPKGEPRRWDHTTVLPTPNSEAVADGRRRRRQEARDGFRHGQRLRLGEAGPGEPDGGVEGLQRRARRAEGQHPRARRRRRRQRRRPRRHRDDQRLVRAAGRRRDGRRRGRSIGELRHGEHRDGRLRRQRRRPDGRRLEPERARMGPGLVRAEEERRDSSATKSRRTTRRRTPATSCSRKRTPRGSRT